ncbi:phosphonate ABC transporter ATP-binding protein [Marinobacterium marinum]|uniref:Phosphonate ABC transporter ATP-binding protein n=1 Tax=Marinobacterium marinum TaxID=2756129 RepID=A0A7W1WVX3_9GAMM|nr:phosphonate ABC transporter ATP-binding protein [Marinobacterium marinum]MBA4501211.1 phosphonate ABC transporter ATP-binding protein [Marinobacterium marinum]
MSILQVQNLKARYAQTGDDILKGISFNVAEGDFYAIIGPSGAGKSTLIRCINRLVEPSEGSVSLFGQELTRLSARELRKTRRHIGMIFQEFNLVNRMSVMDNVLSGRLGYVGTTRSLFKLFPRSDIQRALELLDRVSLIDHVDKRADQLSGGQRQRVGIARALMQDPQLLLLDEPTASLDPKISRDVMQLIRDTARDLGIPVLCNIHDVALAKEFCNRILGLQSGRMMFDGKTADLADSDLERIYELEVL